MKLAELREKIQAKREFLAKVFEQAGPDYDFSKVMDIQGDTAAKVAEVQRLNKELDDLGREFESAKETDRIAQANKAALDASRQPVSKMVHPATGQPIDGKGSQGEFKTLGQWFVEQQEWKDSRSSNKPRFLVARSDADIKVLMTTAAGFAPEAFRSGRVVYSAQRRPMVASLIPDDTTDQTAIRYMEETTFTNNAAPASEGGALGESALVFTERTQPVELIGAWLPVTKQQMDDVQGIQGIIDNRLTLMLLLSEETQIITGNGVTPQLGGFLNKVGVQVQAKGADSVPDAVFKGMTLIRHTGFADVTGIIMHPNDWQDVRLLRTVDGHYIFGSPADAEVNRMWGTTVVPTTAETENTALLGDFQLYSHISRKAGISIEVSDSHSDYFVKNQLAIRIEERICLEIYRAAAFCTVTGI